MTNLISQQKERYIGLMSGTSLDAVDVVAALIDDHEVLVESTIKQLMPESLREDILAVNTGASTTLADIGLIDNALGKWYASAVETLLEQSQIKRDSVTAIGNHGQTVFHHPTGEAPFTMQLGDANIIAAVTGIDTIADFRRMDMALGGQGAPLTPAFHHFLFRSHNKNIVVLNVGGICNITVLSPDEPTLGFDTGPGNLLMDLWCQQHTGELYDHDAQWALQGELDSALLDVLMSDPFLKKVPPKSTGREHYNLNWLASQFPRVLPAANVQRTLCEFTALSASRQIQTFWQSGGIDNELLVCGGGAYNPLLMQLLQTQLPDWSVMQTSDFGLPVDQVEASAFAWLARQRVHELPSSIPEVTGACRSATLGVVYKAP